LATSVSRRRWARAFLPTRSSPFCRSPTSFVGCWPPYVALAGVAAVVAAVLNAQGRVVAVALGIAAFNAVLLAALASIAAFARAPPSVIGETLAHAIVLAGVAQLVVTGVGFLHLRRGRALSGEADTGSPQKVRQLDEPPRRRFGLSADARKFFALAVPG